RLTFLLRTAVSGDDLQLIGLGRRSRQDLGPAAEPDDSNFHCIYAHFRSHHLGTCPARTAHTRRAVRGGLKDDRIHRGNSFPGAWPMLRHTLAVLIALAGFCTEVLAQATPSFEKKTYNYSDWTKGRFSEAVVVTGPGRMIFLAGVGAEDEGSTPG